MNPISSSASVDSRRSTPFPGARLALTESNAPDLNRKAGFDGFKGRLDAGEEIPNSGLLHQRLPPGGDDTKRSLKRTSNRRFSGAGLLQ
jgi:hypothetical protein